MWTFTEQYSKNFFAALRYSQEVKSLIFNGLYLTEEDPNFDVDDFCGKTLPPQRTRLVTLLLGDLLCAVLFNVCVLSLLFFLDVVRLRVLCLEKNAKYYSTLLTETLHINRHRRWISCRQRGFDNGETMHAMIRKFALC